MSFQRITRTGVLRQLYRTDALSRPSRVIGVQNQLRQLSLASKPQVTTRMGRYLPAIAFRSPRSYSTETSKPEAKKARSSSKSSKGKSKTKKSSKSKPKKKRALTANQKEEKAKEERRDYIKQLKETALKEPKKLPQIVISLVVQEKLLGGKGPRHDVREAFKDAISYYHSMSAEEREVCWASCLWRMAF